MAKRAVNFFLSSSYFYQKEDAQWMLCDIGTCVRTYHQRGDFLSAVGNIFYNYQIMNKEALGNFHMIRVGRICQNLSASLINEGLSIDIILSSQLQWFDGQSL